MNPIYEEKEVPDEWLQSVLIPIFKKGNPNNCANYRGIALMAVCAKLFNRMLLVRLLWSIKTSSSKSEWIFTNEINCSTCIMSTSYL